MSQIKTINNSNSNSNSNTNNTNNNNNNNSIYIHIDKLFKVLLKVHLQLSDLSDDYDKKQSYRQSQPNTKAWSKLILLTEILTLNLSNTIHLNEFTCF